MSDDYFRAAACFIGAAIVLAAAPLVQANVTNGAWPSGPITLTFRLDNLNTPALPPTGLTDGSANWNAAVRPVLDMWNAHLLRSQMASVTATTGTPSSGNGINDVFFDSTIYGEAFGSRTLAVTLISNAGIRGIRFTETDVIFNTGRTWDSYRGTLHSGVVDIRRVALHEFGHVLGLDHPDEDHPAQSVAAIMNSTISDVDILQPDDIAGAEALYPSAIPAQNFTRQPPSLNAGEGDLVTLSFDLNGAPAPAPSAIVQYSWFFTPTGGTKEFLFTADDPVMLLGSAQPNDSGAYQVEVDTPNGETTSAVATVNIAPVVPSTTTRLGNLSTRGLAGTGSRSMIVGFVVGGSQNLRVLLRAVGPSLGKFNVTGAIADPVLDLMPQSGAKIASNDNWGDSGGGPALAAAFSQTGAFSLFDGSADAALVATLAPGLYTAVVTPKDGIEGVALVEAYDLDNDGSKDSRLVNLSTRGPVGTGANIMIAGLIVNGSGPKKYLLRAVGDTLQGFGVSGTLDDPFITLFDGGGTPLRSVDDWDVPASRQPTLTQTMTSLQAFTLTDRQESVLIATLNPGKYTLQVSGLDGGTGVAIVEAYEIGN